jgi:predicted permease
VTPGYFAALDVGLARGRGFAESDRLPDRHAIILNETLAKRLFAGGDPIGQQLRLFREAGPWRTVVGVAQDVKNDGLTERPGPEFYLPWKNDPAESPAAGYVVVRTQMNAKGVAEWMRTEVRSFDATLPVRIETLTQRVGKLRARPKFNAMLLASFAAMGLLLAAIGIYGVVRYLVAERTQEIGVRMALGATRGTILSLMLGGMARWTLAGAAVGLAGGWMAARLLESLLFEVRAHETMVYAAALALLITVAFLAAWFPARKATRVDPMVALRCA